MIPKNQSTPSSNLTPATFTYHDLVLSLYEGYGQYTGTQGFISQAQLRRFAIHIFNQTQGLGLERFQPQ